MLWGDGHQGMIRVDGSARVAAVLPEEDAAVAAEMQRVSVVLPLGVVLLEGEVEPLPVHAATRRQTHVHRELSL